ncbi:hypothetical protein SmJEL517_g05791 [Synchytrium microbalum]|uniref:Nodulin-like domain-containing protein n=1 Tax=Synchytrium microbalum TaxID=1806994 RepID=A0A507BTY5_9FUNG|nr:uncharacterized protein SmJEL517_g05791 [Synchytrium microbalum]TPX30711.1 hypothetical protein SmJEL517_g05791 [Synchytrium microbalum]
MTSLAINHISIPRLTLSHPSGTSVKRWTTFGVSIFVMATAGSMFAFSSISEGLRVRFNYDATQLNLVSALGNAALYVTMIVSGPFYDTFGASWTMLVGGLIYGFGYLFMYLTYIGLIEDSSVTLVAIYYFLAGFGSTTAYMASMGKPHPGINVMNFPPKQMGLVTGILLLFYGLSATFYSQLYSTNLMDTGSFLLFLTVSSVIVNTIAACLVFKAPPVAATKLAEAIPPSESEASPSLLPLPSTPWSSSTASSPPVYTLETSSTRTSPKRTPTRIAGAVPSMGFVQDQRVVDELDLSDEYEMISRADDGDAIGVQDHEKSMSIESEGPWTSNINTYAPEEEEEASLTPFQMLNSLTFFLFAIAYIWQQGLTYFSNISTIVTSLMGADVDPATLNRMISTHITILSVFNSAGRFAFGLFYDIVSARFPRVDRSILLIVVEILLLVPMTMLGWGDISSQGLYMCSILIGLGFGAGGSLFPPLTRDFFGVKYYGTACGLVMVAVPAGIFVSNLVFGHFYDLELRSQRQSSPPSTTSVCYGESCIKLAFGVQAAIQLIPLVMSIALYAFRTWRKNVTGASKGR